MTADLPPISYPEDLPVSGRRDDILAALRSHQVVIVAGATGSGKTTQLPKMLLELGKERIAHTQPRRIAARSVAERVAEELGVELGGLVGYKVRFTDQVSRATRIALMTDGILLNEIHRDPDLRRYDAIVIDEAHERSLTVDFLLGYLRRLLPRRPDLTVVVTSATIDPESFAQHFAAADGTPAPIIEVSGRTYPVEIRYRPLVPDARDEPLPASARLRRENTAEAGNGPAEEGAEARAEERDTPSAILDALRELEAEPPGDVLVFLSGEAEIRDAMDAIVGAGLRGTEVLPLYGRLSAAEQHRVFETPPPGTRRRVILSTNVAETSLTVPGIRYVIDEGMARISRWSARSKVQRLPIEPISQASAAQRAGRSGRLAPGVCIRLYSETDFMRRPAYTEPEILRTDLAAVLLQMAVLDLGDIADFPFLEPPDRRGVRDGMQLLAELGAIDADGTVTRLGRELSRIPLDPRFGRMLIAARELGVVEHVLPIVAALSIQDPRERPEAAREQADAAHRRHADPGSDFLTLLRLWRHLEEQQAALSGSAFRRLLKAEYLSYLRVREWQDTVRQLRSALELPRSSRPSAALESRAAGDAMPGVTADRVHRAILAGLLSRIGVRDERTSSRDARAAKERRRQAEYLGARNARFAIHPSSPLARKGPDAVMAAELVETSRLFARTVAAIDPAWAEDWAGDLAIRTVSEPRWDARRGEAIADEKVTLYGVPIVPRRRIRFARVDPEYARELFIRHALVGSEEERPSTPTGGRSGEARTIDARAGRSSVGIEGAHSARGRVSAFDRLPGPLTAFHRANAELREHLGQLEERTRRRDLTLDDEAFVAWYRERIPVGIDSTRAFERWWRGERETNPELLTMRERDFVSDELEEEDRGAGFPVRWRNGDLELALAYRHAPGAADDGVTLVIPHGALAAANADGTDWLVPGMREELIAGYIKTLPKVLRREVVPAGDWARRLLPDLPQPEVDESAPHARFAPTLAAVIKKATFAPVTAADFELERLPEHLRMNFRIVDARGRPIAEGRDLEALRAEVIGAAERRSTTEAGIGREGSAGSPGVAHASSANAATPAATGADGSAKAREAAAAGGRAAPPPATQALIRYAMDHLTDAEKLVLASSPYSSVPALLADGIAVSDGTPDDVFEVVSLIARTLAAAREADKAIRSATSLALVGPLRDARAQLEALIHPGFVTATGRERLPRLPMYLAGIIHRVGRLADNLGRDRVWQSEVEQAIELYRKTGGELPLPPAARPELVRARWLIEELRLSLFAQHLPTAEPVSLQRIRRALEPA